MSRRIKSNARGDGNRSNQHIGLPGCQTMFNVVSATKSLTEKNDFSFLQHYRIVIGSGNIEYCIRLNNLKLNVGMNIIWHDIGSHNPGTLLVCKDIEEPKSLHLDSKYVIS